MNWILDGKLIPVNIKSIMRNTETIVKLSIWHKLNLKLKLKTLKFGVKVRNMKRHLTSLKKFNRSTLAPARFQMKIYQPTGIGETLRVLISLVNIEIRVTVDLATPFHSLKSLSKD